MSVRNTSFIVVVLLCTGIIPLYADVTVNTVGTEITIENSYIARTFDTANNTVTPLSIENKQLASISSISSGEEFIIYLMDSALKASGFTLVSWDQVGDGTGRILTFHLDDSANDWEADLMIQLKTGDHFMKKSLDFRRTRDPAQDVVRIDLESIVVSGAYEPYDVITNDGTWKPGLGQPVYADSGLFFGTEFPASDNKVSGGTVISGYDLGRSVGTSTYTTHSSVCGASVEAGHTRDSFLKYIDAIRIRPNSLNIQYNSWYDYMTNINETNMINSMTQTHENLSKRGVDPLNRYSLDSGWHDSCSEWRVNRKFNYDLTLLENTVESMGSRLGLWMSPLGGYGFRTTLTNHLVGLGYERTQNSKCMCMAGQNYMPALKHMILQHMIDYDVSHFKLDGWFNGACTDTNHGHPTGKNGAYYYTMGTEYMIDIFQAMHAQDPNVSISITVGTWVSPWFLQYVDFVWLNNSEDNGFLGDGPSRTQMLRHRDSKMYNNYVADNAQFPLNSVCNLDPIVGNYPLIVETTDELSQYMYMVVSRGTNYIEAYLSPRIIDDEKWTVIADSFKWAREHLDERSRSIMFGGDPALDQVYGYSGWTNEKGYISMHNPSASGQSYSISLNRNMGVMPATGPFWMSSPFSDTRENGPYYYDDTINGTLNPYEVTIMEFCSLQDNTLPTIDAVGNVGIDVEVYFSEEVEETSATNAGNYSIDNGITITSAARGPGFKTIHLNARGLQAETSYTVTVSNVCDSNGNTILNNTQKTFVSDHSLPTQRRR